jgi:hypothetical protein
MSDRDGFQLNIIGASDLVENPINKVGSQDFNVEGKAGEEIDAFFLPMDDAKLLTLRDEWESLDGKYTSLVMKRAKKNKLYLAGKQRSGKGDTTSIIPDNMIFQAQETFIPQALAKNPEPVVFSDNTEEGKFASNEIKTLLQYHADTLCLRQKLAVMVRQWNTYFLGIIKHGWNKETSDISLDLRRPQNFVFDPDGYIDEYGNYRGRFLGEKIEKTAEKLAEMYPKHKEVILDSVAGKGGTKVIATEWWTDEYCFTTYQKTVLEKHKNEFFNYQENESDITINHFPVPKMPYTFLSVFSLQEEPFDFTNLTEQAIPNQDRITRRDGQIDKNLNSGNNAVALSGRSFTSETASQVVDSFYEEGFILVPDGDVTNGVRRIPAPGIPDAVFRAQDNDKVALQSVFGTYGVTPQKQTDDTTVRGQILNQSHDSSRIGGGIGDKLEQVADNIFNWWGQLYCVFYDEPHYAAIMGSGRAVEYVQITQANFQRKFVISVQPNSMAPKDEITEINQAIDLANKGWLDPITLFKRLNYPDPMETAKAVTMWKSNPRLYLATYFPEQAQQSIQQQENPPDLNQIRGQGNEELSATPASAALSQVPINQASSLPTT